MNIQDLADAVEAKDINIHSDFAHHDIADILERLLAVDPDHFKDAFLDSLCSLNTEGMDTLQRSVMDACEAMHDQHRTLIPTPLATSVTMIGCLVLRGWLDAVESRAKSSAEEYLADLKQHMREVA